MNHLRQGERALSEFLLDVVYFHQLTTERNVYRSVTRNVFMSQTDAFCLHSHRDILVCT
jgi:hypothetical protein